MDSDILGGVGNVIVTLLIILVVFSIPGIIYELFFSKENKEPTINDMFIESDRLNSNFMSIYKSKFGGYYYPSKTVLSQEDEKIFSGTQTECENWLQKNNHKQPDFMK